MHTIYSRFNAVTATASTVLTVLLALVAASSFVIPTSIQPATIAVPSINVMFGRVHDDYERKSREYAFTKFDIRADLRPLFHWNTKQLFVYLVADYSTPNYPSNQVVLWDRIVRRKNEARINISGHKNKYHVKDISDKWSNVTATFKLQYNLMPWVGLLQYGEAGHTQPIPFPPAQKKLNQH